MYFQVFYIFWNKMVSISETCTVFMYHTKKQMLSILLAQNIHSSPKSRTLYTWLWRQGYVLLQHVMQVKNSLLLEDKSSTWTNIWKLWFFKQWLKKYHIVSVCRVFKNPWTKDSTEKQVLHRYFIEVFEGLYLLNS